MNFENLMKEICFLATMIICTVSSLAQDIPLKQLDSLFRHYFKDGEPGAAMLIAKDGQVIYKNGFGVSDINTKEKITSQTLFNLGSISKTFVAYGILKLAAEQKLSIEDNITKYFSDFKNPQVVQHVKIYHLLTHTSGLPDNRKVSENKEFYLWAKDEENFAPLKQTDTLEFEPGTKYKYSNPAFNGLALIIEKVKNEKWQDYIRKTIFKPAGMDRSTITDGSYPETGVSHAYVKNKKGGFDEMDYGEETTFAAAGNGGVWSSVEELWKYEQAIQHHKFIDSRLIKISRTVYPLENWRDTTASRLGISWFLTRESDMSMIGHTGSQGGFISDYCWLPEEKTFYVLLCNQPFPIKEIRTKVFSILKLGK